MKYKRIFVIVMDSLGIGNDENQATYDDEGANTLLHIWQSQNGIHMPNLLSLGLGKLDSIDSVQTKGYALALHEQSLGKDTMTGHWEMMGLYIDKPFLTFSNGFPEALIKELEQQTGHKVIGNKAASGTVILDELAEEEIATGHMIVYTSADSVLQICGNEETFGLDELYRCCEIARKITMKDEWKVGRVIARPYTGKKKGEFKRTSNRHDYALKPYGKTALNALKENHYDVISIGKINDIFVKEGITKAYKSSSSVHGMQQTIDMLKEDFTGLCFTNLVDFDALWGHRRNPEGYKKEIEMFDEKLEIFLNNMNDDDLVIISADHGNDPTFKGTDHTREHVPCLIYSPNMKKYGILNDESTFAIIGNTITDNFNVKMPENTIGHSILNKLI